MSFNKVIIGFVVFGLFGSQLNSQDAISFNRDIRPILSDKCFHCHGPDEHTREADLRFDIKESAFKDLGGYQAIKAGDPDASELIKRILSEDESEVMPPPELDKPLTENEKKLLSQWVEEGAKWQEFWAYIPPRKTAIPKVTDQSWPNNWIDSFVLSRIESKGLRPNKPADKTTLLRRVHFDLIGLPPSPKQVEDFLNNDSPNAFEQVVDELLNSPHFGEKLAIYWLDLVRYADTVGYHGDQDHNISPYRDWVIDAFNSDMPFDQFTREQLAGDLLPNPSESQRVASGYNRLLQTTHEGGLQPKEYRAIYAADRVRNVSLVWMGATVGCAQCHNHKYDPYTANDFYSLSAFFADIDDEQHFKSGTNSLPTKRAPEILIIDEESRKSLEEIKIQISELDKRKRELDKKQKNKNTTDESKQQLAAEAKTVTNDLNRLRARHREIESRGAWTMVTSTLKTPRVTRLLPRGNWLDESGPVVEPAIPTFLGAIESEKRLTRLDLANWLTDQETDVGRLTARVMANRIWYLMMGVGLSRSLDDFGGQGYAPDYPELLDQLAVNFAENDWSIKKLIREIVTSKTYQQSSQVSQQQSVDDPLNQYFARQSRYRLPAELIRDNALAISGLLNLTQVGGKSIKPYQPSGYYQHLNFPKRKYSHHKDSRQWRRGVYVHWQRQFLHPSLKAFDAPSREECTAERPQSNTPLAALALLNDTSFVEAAKHFAIRLSTQHPDSFDAQLDSAFMIALSRKPEAIEKSLLKNLYDTSLTEFKSPEKISELNGVGNAPHEPLTQQQAAMTIVAQAILNLDEAITRN